MKMPPANHDTVAAAAQHLRWPAERFYWAELRVDLPTKARVTSPSIRAVLDEAFEPHVPVDFSDVAPAYMKLAEGTVLACAVPISSIEQDAPHAITLAPESLPAVLGDSGAGDPADLNVLTGPHTPIAVVHAERKRAFALSTCAAGVLVLLCLGLWLRLARADNELAAARAAAVQISRSPVAAAIPAGLLPFDQRAFAELARLRATRSASARTGVTDAAALLEPVLRRWPAQAKARATELSVGPSGVTIGAIVNTPTDADRLVTAFAQSPGWQAPRSEINTQGTIQRVRITMSPSATTPTPTATGPASRGVTP